MQAAVCRDSSGKIVKAISQVNPPCYPTFGEALAARLVASMVALLQLKFFSLEGDPKIVIVSLTSLSITIDWHIDSVIANTLALLPTVSLWEVKKIHRSANFCTHHMAFWVAARVFSSCIPTYFGIPIANCHLFQIFAAVLCDLIWFARNKAAHEGTIPDISSLVSSIRKTFLDHATAWNSPSPFVKEF